MQENTLLYEFKYLSPYICQASNSQQETQRFYPQATSCDDQSKRGNKSQTPEPRPPTPELINTKHQTCQNAQKTN